MKEKKMTNKKIWLGVLLILAVFGVVLGCASTPSSYFYNLGDVSEENCALIQVSPLSPVIDVENQRFLESAYPYINLVKIDGQGDIEQWQKPPIGLFGFPTKAIVRVTPGVHTFTIAVIYDDDTGNYFVFFDITYDCKAGKAYSFEFLAQDPVAERMAQSGFFTLNEKTGERGKVIGMGFLATTIIINEANVGENGSFGFGKEVGKKTESLALNSDLQRSPDDPRQTVDRDRLVRRPD
jgi:hypothetical protein